MTQPRAYLDCNATEPLRPEARAAFVAALEACGNPSSVHAEGRRARALVETARASVGRLVGARAADVVFTSGATEANNAILSQGWSEIALSRIEHDSVLRPAEARAEGAARLAWLDLDNNGCVRQPDGRTADGAATADTTVAAAAGRRLLSVHLAGNETGVLQPVAELASAARSQSWFVHTDAAQAAGRMVVDFAALGVDYMSLSSHKLGGPQGVGALVLRETSPFASVIRGGGQERGRRAGTENVAAIVGFGAAAEAALVDRARLGEVAVLRDELEREALRLAPGAFVVGASSERLPNTSCIVVPGLSAELAVIRLDLAGVAVSAGAACSSGKVGPNRVLLALGLPSEHARCAIRVSLSTRTTRAEVAQFLSAWSSLVASNAATGARAASATGSSSNSISSGMADCAKVALARAV